MFGALLGGFAGKAARWLGQRVAGSAGKAVVRTTRDAVVGGLGAVAVGQGIGVITRMAGTIGGPPALPPTGSFAQGGGGYAAPRPREGIIGRTVSKILPGGMTGYEWAPLDGVEHDKYGRPIAVGPAEQTRLVAPRGYVIVRDPSDPDNAVAMLKGPARAMGLWHPRQKPLISVGDSNCIRRAHGAKRRIAKIAKKAAKC